MTYRTFYYLPQSGQHVDERQTAVAADAVHTFCGMITRRQDRRVDVILAHGSAVRKHYRLGPLDDGSRRWQVNLDSQTGEPNTPECFRLYGLTGGLNGRRQLPAAEARRIGRLGLKRRYANTNITGA